jgi:general secretion pathway protein I
MTITSSQKMVAERAQQAMDAGGLSSYRNWQLTRVDHGPPSRARLTTVAKREAGFTLVEVIVALAILSVGLSALLGMISGGLQQTTNAERKAEAGSLAQSLMAQVGTEWPIKSEERDGQFPNGYKWHLKVHQYGSEQEREEWPVGLYAISTEVEWDDSTQRRSYELTTLRVGPRAAQQ